MTESDGNRLRSELPAMLSRLALSASQLLGAIDSAEDLAAVRTSAATADARQALAGFQHWLKRAGFDTETAEAAQAA